MNKKIILLVLILPLFLMVSLFAATRTLSLAVEVPVSGIEILGEKIVYLDLDQDETYRVDYAVYPTNAKNRDVTFSTERVGESELCELLFSDGEIVPHTAGTAKVSLTTVDGGYTDSFIVEVSSSRLQSIECSVEKSTLSVGETVSVTTVFKPAGASNLLLTYTSSNPSVATVNERGVIRGVGRGNAVITVTSEADPSIKDTIAIEVFQEEQLVIAEDRVTTAQKTGSLNLSVRDSYDYTYTYTAVDKNGQAMSNERFRLAFDTTNAENGHILIGYELLDASYLGKVTVTVTATFDGAVLTESCEIVFANDIEVAFDGEVFSLGAGQSNLVPFDVTPSNATVTLSPSLSNENASVAVVGGNIILAAQKAGTATLTLSVTDPQSGVTKTDTITVVITPRSLIIGESANTYGDENRLAVGAEEFGGGASTVALSLKYNTNEVGAGFTENLSFVSDNPNVTLDASGRIVIANGYVGEATVRGVFSAEGIRYESAPMTIYCVGNGVNVRSFKALYETVGAGKPAVLFADIVNDFGYIDGSMYYTADTVTKIHTTYDDTFYQNGDRLSEAEVMVLLSFRNDLYGNGYTINAGNVTMQLDEVGALKQDALFRGPLNFVSLTDNMASVKAQDNICFALYEGVSIRNVKLYGCTLDSSNGEVDLTDLDYVGTTVEVLGDDVNILYSRVQNGRTVLRVFGDAEDASKKITVNISNSVLGYAREFILRMGSNAFVDPAEGENFAPARLPGDTNRSFPAQKAYATMSDAEKAAYDEAFVKTFVNVKNSVFTESGIFAVGVDSHFSGLYLDRGSTAVGPTFASLVPEWHDLAKTSYGAKLTFLGDVRLYSWKDLDMIDSSTLIEVNRALTENYPDLDLSLNVADMVNTVAEKPGFGNIVYDKDGRNFAHAGITFFGGGYNYGVFEYKDPASTRVTGVDALHGYEINLADADKAFLNSAAGSESFYFLLYDATSSFLPENQDALLSSENAYDCITRRD